MELPWDEQPYPLTDITTRSYRKYEWLRWQYEESGELYAAFLAYFELGRRPPGIPLTPRQIELIVLYLDYAIHHPRFDQYDALNTTEWGVVRFIWLRLMTSSLTTAREIQEWLYTCFAMGVNVL